MKTKSFIKIVGAVALTIATVSGSAFAQLVQPFTPGNLVVERIGNGSATLAAPGTPIFLDQFTTSSNSTPVSSEMIPTNGANSFVDTGNSTTEGFPTLNPYGTNVVLAGYNVPLGATTAGATALAAPRSVATVDGNGTYKLIAANTNFFSGGNIRCAATDGGTNYWAVGSVTGVGYMGLGPTNITSVPANSANNRVIHVVGGNLYFSTGSSTHGIYKISGTPTNTGNTATILINTTALGSTTTSDFEFSPDMSICYIADDDAYTTSAGFGGIEKWTNNVGTWQFLYSLPPGLPFDLAVDWSNPTQPTIYGVATSILFKVQDTGAGSLAVTNAIATANTAFRGLALAPTNTAVVASAPTLTGISPSSLTVNAGATATFTLSGFTGNPVASNRWYVITGGTTNQITNGLQGSGSTVSGASSGALTLTNAALADSASYFAILTNASGSVTSSVVSLTVTPVPTISGISPSGITNSSGSTAVFTLTSSAGTPPASNYWFKISGGTTNLVNGATATALTFSNTVVTNTGNYFAILSNSLGSATSSVVSLVITDAPPTIIGIAPASVTTNSGMIVTFTVTNKGSPPFTYLWYKETASTTNLILGATNATLVLPSVLGGDTANYQVIVTNAIAPFTATSSVVSLTVTNDPRITSQPASAYGLLSNTVQFAVGVIGTTPTYQWYFTDSSGNIVGPVNNGAQASGSVISGATSGILTITNLQLIDVTNFVVTVSNAYGGPVTSSVASLLSVASSAVTLAFWDFNGNEFTNTAINPTCVFNPLPYRGVGSATAVGTALQPGNAFSSDIFSASFSPFAATTTTYDPNDGLGFTSHLPPSSWGTTLYPTNGNSALNKSSGAQFNVSTVGAKNIKFSYESRGTGTASKYERLQYTTNGVSWIDYPSSTVFSSTTVNWYPFSYDLTGFPGVANNPNFGVRIVTEYQSTATYGISPNTNFVGIANTYGTGGTLTYDLVTFTGDAINSTNQPPLVGGFMDTNMVDYLPLTNNFTVSDDSTAPDSLTYSAVSLNTATFNPSFGFQGSGANRQLIIYPNSIAQSVAAAPILVTVTDANGDSTVAWFTVTVGTVNLPPTNSLTQVSSTNMLANTNLVIPFTVGDDRTPTNGQSFSYSVSSGNTTLIPNDSVNSIILSNITPTNLTFTIVPAANQVGVGVVSVTVNDNDLQAPKSTTATIPIMVRPNTNVVMVDYFNYDSPGALDAESGGFWQHLSGNVGQMQVSGGVVTVDTFNNTENLITPLLGAPYATNSGAVLYSSLVVNMANVNNMPRNNGSYFACFQNGFTVAQNGSSATTYVQGCLVAATNGAAPGYYRLGIGNANGSTALTAQMFPQDLSPNVNYVVVTSLVLSNGFSTIWINPTNQSAQSVTDTTPAATATNLYSIQDYELRSSGVNAGAVSVSHLLVGQTFNSVIYPPVANADYAIVNENTSANVLSPLQNDAGSSLSLVSVSPDGNGTAIISGTNILFTPVNNFIGTATVGYTIADTIGDTSSSTITVTVTNTALIPTVPPYITGFTIANTNVVITGTNAQATGVYYLLASTNVALPLSQWIVVATNVVSTANNFTFIGTNAVTSGGQQQFYILSSTNSNHP